MRSLVSVLVFLLVFSMFSTDVSGDKRLPNRFARLYPTELKIERAEETGEVTLTFNANDINTANLIQLSVFTIPENNGQAEITYPTEWLENGTPVTIAYTPLQSNGTPQRVLLVIRMENAVGDWRNWNIGFMQ